MTAGLSFVILYGSQLGQAKSLAEGIAETAANYHLTCNTLSLNEVKDISELRRFSIPIVVITSTTGDGEAPENADKFFRKLRRKNLDAKALDSVRYAILGLGDTNYNNFCNCGKTIHKRFQELGATLFYSAVWADDAVGQDEDIENWIDGLWPTLQALSGIDSNQSLINGEHNVTSSGDMSSSPATKAFTLPSLPQPFIQLIFTEGANTSIDLLTPPAPYPSIDGDPYVAKLASAKVLTKEGSVKTTLEVTLATEGKEFEFEPGDSINIVCPNPASEVKSLLERLKLNGKENQTFELTQKVGSKGKFPPFLPKKSSFQDLFTYFLDIRTAPKKAFVRLLAESTENSTEKLELEELCSREGSSKYEEFIRFPSLSILDILLKYPSCHPPVESLLEHLPRLIPRAYSIASSPFASKTSFTIAFNIIEIPSENGRMYARFGLCTGWFYEIAQRLGYVKGPDNIEQSLRTLSLEDKSLVNDKEISAAEDSETTIDIVFYKRKNHDFRLPKNLNVPVIMVGPGTGVAPFIGFLEHRHFLKKEGNDVGPMYLYYGCRNHDKDFLYRETMELRKSEGDVLTELNVTFSRDPDQGGLKYVQDLMEKNAEKVVSTLLKNGGCIYICGDAKNMAKSIREKLVAMIQRVEGLSTEKEAEDEVAKLVSDKRYLQDIWT